MNRSLIILLIFITFGTSSFGQYVTIQGRQFKDENGEDFYPVACNYLADYLFGNGDTNNLFVSPYHEYDQWCYDCGDFTSCMNQMSDNFNRIREMGFNTIRLFGLQPIYLLDDTFQQFGFRIRANNYDVFHNYNCDTNTTFRYKNYFICRPFSTNATTQTIFTFLDTILVRASKANLKIILLVGGRDTAYSEEFGNMYADYLSALANHIHSISDTTAQAALLAYDLENEPYTCDTCTKQDVCQYVSMWYDSIKTYDPDHLITLGGHSIFDVFDYDPAMLKIDFYSPHYYSVKQPYFTSPFQTMIDQVHGHSLWLENNIPMPYMVGETGYRSNPYGSDGDGDTIQQKQYADSTLEFTRYYSGSGYSWWEYQDYYWSVADCYFGLLYRDTNKLVKEKYLTEAFKNFDPNDPPSPHGQPSLYFDPYNHYALNPDNNHLTGHVYDSSDMNPIKDAVVYGWTKIGKDEKNNDVWETHYTLTDSVGYYRIIPYDYDITPPNYEVMNHIIVSAPGCSQYISVWDSMGVPPGDVSSIFLQRGSFNFTNTIRDSVCTETSYFQAWDNLYFKDVTVLTSVNFEARARREITLDQEFHAASGCEAIIHLDHTWYPCGGINFDYQNEKSSVSNPQKVDSNKIKVMQLQFGHQDQQFDFLIYPNPSSGLFQIVLSNFNSLEEMELLVLDINGKVNLSQKVLNNPVMLDCSNLSPGAFQVMIRNQDYSRVKKIVLSF